MPRSFLLFVILFLCATAPAFAQQSGGAPSPPKPDAMKPALQGAATGTGPLMQAMDNMNKSMAAVPMTGDTDRDFVAMMIAHHQGAIDMAKIELASGKDPTIRKLAQEIIAAQQHEIRQMQAWQKHRKQP